MASRIIKHIPGALSKLHPSITASRGIGATLIDDKGNQYLDLTSGIGALSTGHCHPYVVSEVMEQVGKLVHAPQQIFGSHEPQIDMIEKMLTILPPKLDTIFPTNSGSEATDNAIKLSRKHNKKSNIISILGGFHGRTIGALSLNSSGTSSKRNAQPLMPGVFFVNPDNDSLTNALLLETSPEETSAIIMEPVQGECGVFSIDSEFMQCVRRVCDEYNINMILDEVQCGAGRTGTWWNFEQKEVVPDILTFGKGIGSGFPIAGIASTSKIMDSGTNFLGGTYNGGPIPSRAVTATIEVIEKEHLMTNVIERGQQFKDGLQKSKHAEHIRQHGLMIAFSPIPDTIATQIFYKYNQPTITNFIVDKLRQKNILVLKAGPSNEFIRLLPPLNVTHLEVEEFLNNYDDAVEEVVNDLVI